MRYIGGAWTFDAIAEICRSGAGGKVHRIFCENWWSAFVTEFWDDWIRPPTSDEEIRRAMEPYIMGGMPGCVASTDGFTVEWPNCPSSQTNSHKGGKNGKKPVKNFSLTVLHSRWIAHITLSFVGMNNDRTMSRWDEFLQAVHRRTLYETVEYTVYSEDGTAHIVRGCWILCDNGYHKWRTLQPPKKNVSSHIVSHQLASILIHRRVVL